MAYTNNRSTMLSCREEPDALYLRLHRMFLDAPVEVLDALALYLTEEDTEAGRVVDRFIGAQTERLETAPREVRTRGRFHDLQAILEELNATFFHGASTARITWGHAGTRRYRQSIQLGCYVGPEQLIRIHPCLDQAFVPREYVSWVVFHEMLHEVFGVAAKDGGRRTLHPPELEAVEETFPGYRECKEWEAANLHRLLRYRPNSQRRP